MDSGQQKKLTSRMRCLEGRYREAIVDLAEVLVYQTSARHPRTAGDFAREVLGLAHR